jgi:hypothetical protein
MLNDDVLLLLFNYLISLGGEGRTMLARLARTKKAMRDLAIPVLWRALDSFEPLICLLFVRFGVIPRYYCDVCPMPSSTRCLSGYLVLILFGRSLLRHLPKQIGLIFLRIQSMFGV